MKQNKTAIILLNIGGPDSLNSVRPFLYNFFSDKNIINLPALPRKIIAFLISSFRYKKSSKNYAKIGGKSPLLENTLLQANALEQALGKASPNEFKCFIAMRYWHPMTPETINAVIEYDPDEIILLPLYPQYSFATTKSSFEEWDKCFKNVNIKVRKIISYESHPLFIKAHAESIIDGAKEILVRGGVLIFSAHGIPKNFVERGDPYEAQTNKTVNAIIFYIEKKLGQKVEYELCYQSRVGKLEWLRPYLKDTLPKYSAMDVIIVPISFVSEHIETLEELDVEYRTIAQDLGIKSYTRIGALGTNEDFINCLADLVLKL